MLYDQLKFAYPEALINFYETQAGLIQCADFSEKQEPLGSQEIFDYDDFSLKNGSKILEHINAFTIAFDKPEGNSFN